MANIERGDSPTSDIQAVARVAQICELFVETGTVLSASEIGEETGLNRTTAYRYCSSMVAAGILERGPRRGTFAVGNLMIMLGLSALGRHRVVEVAPPHLELLRRTVGMTAALSLWRVGGPVVAVVDEEASGSLMITVRVGTKLDLATSQTLVFLAYLDESARRDLVKGCSAEEMEQLTRDIESIRERGYCVMEFPGMLFAAAAPIFDEHGICATVAIIGAGHLVDLSETSPALGELKRAAKAIGDELSHRGATPAA